MASEAIRTFEPGMAAKILDAPELTFESGRQIARLEISLQVRVIDAAANTSRSYLSRDLSADGVFVRTTHPIATGTRLKVEFVLPKVRVFKMAGEVTRQLGAQEVSSPGEAGMAIRFRDIAKADADALRAFLVNHGVR